MWWKSSPSAGENHGFTVGFTTRWSNQRQPGGFDRARLLAAYLFFPILCIYPIYPSIYPRTYICTRIIHCVPFPSIYLSIYIISYMYICIIYYISYILYYAHIICVIYIYDQSAPWSCFVSSLRAPTSLSGDLHPNPSLRLGGHIRWKWRFQR